MKYGYARVSTEDQNPAMQLTALKKAGCKTVFKDEVTGAHVKEQSPLGVYHFAEAYLKAAAHLSKGIEEKHIKLRFHAPVRYLYSHALENVMKSFLMTKGYAQKKWGHNLVALYSECIRKKLPLGRKGWAERKRLIELINSHHDTPYTFRYLQTGYARVPTDTALSDICNALFKAVRPFTARCSGRRLDPIRKPLT